MSAHSTQHTAHNTQRIAPMLMHDDGCLRGADTRSESQTHVCEPENSGCSLQWRVCVHCECPNCGFPCKAVMTAAKRGGKQRQQLQRGTTAESLFPGGRNFAAKHCQTLEHSICSKFPKRHSELLSRRDTNTPSWCPQHFAAMREKLPQMISYR